MQQRRLRLGETVDDYCPRERRLTSHAIVAMVEDEIKTTRCVTCDFEHAYKDGKVPPRRKKVEAAGVAVPARLSGATADESADLDVAVVGAAAPVIRAPQVAERPPAEQAASGVEAAEAAGATDVALPRDEGFHRRLIRATLPRPAGQAEPRPIPDFTVRQRALPNVIGRRPAGAPPSGQPRNGHRPMFKGGNAGNRFEAHGARGPFQGGPRPHASKPKHGKRRSR